VIEKAITLFSRERKCDVATL